MCSELPQQTYLELGSWYEETGLDEDAKRLFRLALLWGIVFSVVGVMDPWNASYEGSLTQKNALPEHFKNSFLANAFVFCWQTAPDSAITQMFMDRVYGREYAMLYLLMELNNRNERAGLKKVTAQIQEMMNAAEGEEKGDAPAPESPRE